MTKIETNGVVVRIFPTAAEATIVRSMLEGYGIDSFIRDPNISSILPNIPISAGNIELIVREEDYEKAKSILSAKFDKKDIDL